MKEITYRLTLANGATFEITSKRPLKFWKSDLMRRTPYGVTSFVGCRFEIAR
jgi:hypothetical protein